MNTQDERLGLPSASKFGRIAACPGSDQLCRSLPAWSEDIEVDDLTARGLRIHKARETAKTHELSPEELEIYEQGIRQEALVASQWAQIAGVVNYAEGERELRLWLHDDHLNPICSGRLDAHYRALDNITRALVVDWKTGFCSKLLPATANWQLLLQAVLLKEECPELTDIRVAFIKPVADQQGKRLDYADYGPEELVWAREMVVGVLRRASQPDAPRYPGSHCFYCPANAHCPEAAAYAMLPLAKVDPGQSLLQLKGKERDEAIEQLVGALPPEALLKMWDADTVVRKILDAADARLKLLSKEQLAELGLELPEHGYRDDKIEMVQAAFKFLRDQLSFPENELWMCLRFSREDLVELTMSQQKLGKKEAGSWVDQRLEQFIRRGFKAPALKRGK